MVEWTCENCSAYNEKRFGKKKCRKCGVLKGVKPEYVPPPEEQLLEELPPEPPQEEPKVYDDRDLIVLTLNSVEQLRADFNTLVSLLQAPPQESNIPQEYEEEEDPEIPPDIRKKKRGRPKK